MSTTYPQSRVSDHAADIVFIDGGLADIDSIVAGLSAHANYFVLDPAQDGIRQMAGALEEYRGLRAIHVLSHGSTGRIRVGTAILDQSSLSVYGDALRAIGDSLAPDGDLLLYGCDVGRGDAGQAFIAALAATTRADVAASTNPTGRAALGGDWGLESVAGAVDSVPLEVPLEYALGLVNGTAATDYLYGAWSDDTIIGGAGNDILYGEEGDDVLDGGAGADRMTGGSGNDTYVLAQSDNANGIHFADLLRSSQGSELIDLSMIGDTPRIWLMDYTGDGLVDFLSITQAASAADSSFGLTLSTVGLGRNLQVGTYRDTERTASAGSGHPGLDFSYNGLGASQVFGNFTINEIDIDYSGGTPTLLSLQVDFEGHEVTASAPPTFGSLDYHPVGPLDTLMEYGSYGGIDTVRAPVSYTLPADIENLVLVDQNAIDGTGNRLANQITGNDGDNVLVGAAGADTLTGGAGRDRFRYLAGTDSVAAGMDTIADFANGDSIDFFGMEGIALTTSEYPFQGGVANTIDSIQADARIANSIVGFSDGTDGYLYVKGAGSGVDFSGTQLHLVGHGGTFSSTEVTMSIGPTSMISIAPWSADHAEGNGGMSDYTFTVRRTGDVTGTSSVAWAVTGRGADRADPDDFGGNFESGRITFSVDETSKTLTVHVSGDSTLEWDEEFAVTLFGATNSNIGAGSASGIIRSEELLPRMSISALNASRVEGNSGSTPFTFTISRVGDPRLTSSVSWTINSTGQYSPDEYDFPGNWYPNDGGTVTFAANESSKTITIRVAADTRFEPDESFAITLFSPVGGTLGTATATGTILNDDIEPLVSPTDDSVSLSGNPLIDGLVQGSSWQFSTDSRVITYSFSTYLNSDESATYTWNADERAAIVNALRSWENVANIRFREAGSGTDYERSTADIAFVPTGLDLENEMGALGVGIFPSPYWAGDLLDSSDETRETYRQPEGDVYLDNRFTGFHLNPGGYGYGIIVHEIGHALGLKHPTDDGGNGRPTFAQLGIPLRDNQYSTIMAGPESFGTTDGNAATPMPLDVLVIQSIYGANSSFATGDDTYVLANDGIVKTVWDAGGIDTVDASSRARINLNLTPGTHTTYGGHSAVAIAYGAIIENAIGSNGADTLTGNDADNILSGGKSADTLIGGAGNDYLDGGAGTDMLRGGVGNDVYIIDDYRDQIVEAVNGGIDTIEAAIGKNHATKVLNGMMSFLHLERLFPETTVAMPDNVENLLVTGEAPTRVVGNNLANRLVGNGRDNVIDGRGGDDVLIGGGGADTLVGGSGADEFHIDRIGRLVTAIADYSLAEGDRIALSGALFDELFENGTMRSGVFGAATSNGFSSSSPGQRLLYNTATGALWYDRDGATGRSAPVQIASLGNRGTVSTESFVLAG